MAKHCYLWAVLLVACVLISRAQAKAQAYRVAQDLRYFDAERRRAREGRERGGDYA